MKTAMWRGTTILLAMALVVEVSVHDFKNKLRPYIAERDSPDVRPYSAAVHDIEYIRHIHSMFDAYRSEAGGGRGMETSAPINPKYRTWKRNADIINSLLALPKGMNDAGR